MLLFEMPAEPPDVWLTPLTRALVIAVVDSDCVAGQNPPLVFFFGAWEGTSPLVGPVGDVFALAVAVDVEEAVEEDDAIDEDELVRWMPLFWGRNMRETSSAFIDVNPPGAPAPAFQPSRDSDWKLGGEATAVVMEKIQMLEGNRRATDAMFFSGTSNLDTKCVLRLLNPTKTQTQRTDEVGPPHESGGIWGVGDLGVG